MVNARSAILAGTILLVSAAVGMGTNLAFAQQGSNSGSFLPSCDVEASGYHSCNYLGLAQAIGAGLVAGVVAVAVGLGVYGRRYKYSAAAYA